ncbi:hypothetical protein SAMN05216189_10684 [Pseudomonas delhiensis]|uniref:FAD/FMN-containing dehydrogenase n=1 Tax=Pseudomonas delhiensis TaxID=366289 RepID=A0A239G7X1_9PSED|nr:FAD/FMN-containing dehydrogenase [Pseudomonas delhiensis]SDL07396.1 hypothetical protein SAMN05216189_10684 [Pseudomonas delhiensis]SNS65257.1 hypothetical protein SAMN06295949_10523 [Pseudomonas delhiensis]
MRSLCAALLLSLVPLLGLAAGEEGAPAGWTLLDQYEKPYTQNDDLKVLLVARDMAGGKLLKAALEGRPQGYLERRHAVFVADISRMPSLVSKMFAVPAMRDYNYRVLLDREPRVASHFQVPADSLLWISLQQGRVAATQAYDSAPALREALEQVRP